MLAIKPAEIAEVTSAVEQGLTWRTPAPDAVVAPAMVNAFAVRRNDLAAKLNSALTGKTRVQVVEALLDGTFHPAVCIDWSKA